MPFDDPKQDLHFDIKYAVHSFRHAPPPKVRRAETERWKDSLAAHIMAHLKLCGWKFEDKKLRKGG